MTHLLCRSSGNPPHVAIAFGVLTVMSACGSGGGNSDPSYSEMVARSSQIESETTTLVPWNNSAFPDVGTATYDGVVRFETNTTNLGFAGEMRYDIDFGANTSTASTSNWRTEANEPLNGSLGTDVDNISTTNSGSDILGGMSGVLTGSESGTTYDISAGYSGNLLGTGEYIAGVFSGTVSINNGAAENFAGTNFTERVD